MKSNDGGVEVVMQRVGGKRVAPMRVARALVLSVVVASVSGCSNLGSDISNYLNLRNSFLNPSEVGRFDKAKPWGNVKPVTWPVLDQLDVVDEPQTHWTMATDPLPSDLVVDTQEYVVGEGDDLQVSIFELVTPGLDYVKQVRVNELGDINIQNIGRVHIAGLTPSQIEEKIGQVAVEMKLLLKKGDGNPGPQVSVTLLQSHARVFSIIGAVGQPATYNILAQDFRLLDALALARDIQGGMQPGMDYLYVIRPAKGAGVIPATRPAAGGGAPTAPAGGGGNPLDTLEHLDKGATTLPRSSSAEPVALVRPMAMVDVAGGARAGGGEVRLAQADLEKALMTPPGAAATGPATMPATAPVAAAAPAAATAPAEAAAVTPPAATAPVATGPGPFMFVDGKWVPVNPAATPAMTMPATTVEGGAPIGPVVSPVAGTAPSAATAQGLMEQAVGGGGQFIFVDGKWVPVSGAATQGGGGAAGGAGLTPTETAAAASGLEGTRVIRIPLYGLMEGNPKYNIVIRPGDIIRVPNIEPGEFYIMGHVNRPGVYSITGRKVTLKQAMAAAGNLDALAIPRRCDLVRRIGDQEVTVQVNLQAIFDGEQPDIYLKANDLVNVGTDSIAPWLAVTRNAYRLSYGFGFVYDRNFYIQPNST